MAKKSFARRYHLTPQRVREMELLKNFEFIKILKTDSTTKSITILGEIDHQHAIVIMTKTAFSAKPVDYQTDIGIDEFRSLVSNDVYHWYISTLFQSLDNPQAKVDLIYPASETHIKKHSPQKKIMITETPEMYEQIVAPYIETRLGSRIQWVHNILFHGAEADKVVYKDDDETNGFVLVPDMKWDGRNIQELYLVAIVRRKDLRSIRDLNYSHIEFLEKMRGKILTSVSSLYKISKNHLKLYFHYQPSYYHLHIHVANVGLQQFDFGRSILMENVIDQLKYLGYKGFSQLDLTYMIGTEHELAADLEKFQDQSEALTNIC